MNPTSRSSRSLLSVLGEGTFLNLLSFLGDHGPDPVTRTVARLALQDEARHVAFGQAHLEHRLATEPELRAGLRRAVERRHDSLRDTAGLNAACARRPGRARRRVVGPARDRARLRPGGATPGRHE